MAKKLDINTKEKILKVCKQTIAKMGVSNFSLRTIASKANISLGTLYYYYKTKHELIMDLASIYFKKLDKEYFDWLKRHEHDLTKERFLDVIFLKGAKIFEKGNIHVFLLNECISGNKELQKKYQNIYKTWQDNLKIGIRQVFPKVKDKDTLASLLMMAVDGMIFQELLKFKDKNNTDKIKKLLEGFAK